jgi:hypothetical protein
MLAVTVAGSAAFTAYYEYAKSQVRDGGVTRAARRPHALSAHRAAPIKVVGTGTPLLGASSCTHCRSLIERVIRCRRRLRPDGAGRQADLAGDIPRYAPPVEANWQGLSRV